MTKTRDADVLPLHEGVFNLDGNSDNRPAGCSCLLRNLGHAEREVDELVADAGTCACLLQGVRKAPRVKPVSARRRTAWAEKGPRPRGAGWSQHLHVHFAVTDPCVPARLLIGVQQVVFPSRVENVDLEDQEAVPLLLAELPEPISNGGAPTLPLEEFGKPVNACSSTGRTAISATSSPSVDSAAGRFLTACCEESVCITAALAGRSTSVRA